ncbi:hypothetical protein XBKB1_2740019 [Xenorhabdus bovienii str. kraussei Becker Underwood]|uniref:Uncharacterized protein n=1 Tax=Xenorhabdus bovienii str. kraussei Becker Underwood TaxID=1398204 RepID=A0A077PUG8_XENBV|nr:hypothetical protein XBKB1_2740019 [Xenorhabdus bovienii str. kraussei Becker Underwood]
MTAEGDWGFGWKLVVGLMFFTMIRFAFFGFLFSLKQLYNSDSF